MTISFSCPKCSTPFRVDRDKAGKRSKCPRCRTVLTVPASPMSPKPSALGTPSEEDIFRMLEEMKSEPVTTQSSDETVMDETAIDKAAMSPLTPTPANSMPPVPSQPKLAPSISPQVSAAEAAESALRQVRKARKGR